MDLAVSHNNMQSLQYESNTRYADLREARVELLETQTATYHYTTQLNRDQMCLRAPRRARSHCGVHNHLALSIELRNKRFLNDLNTLVETHTTNPACTTDIRPTLGALRQAQDAACGHDELLTTSSPQLPALVLDPITPRCPRPQTGVQAHPVLAAHTPPATEAVAAYLLRLRYIYVSVCCLSARLRFGRL